MRTTAPPAATVEVSIPPGLAAIAAGRDHIPTPAFAAAIDSAPKTVYRRHSEEGHVHGIRPLRLGKKLLWPVAEIAALLQRGPAVEVNHG